MISASDFRKQIAKPLSEQLKTLGFKGSGFNYIMEGNDFIFTIGVQGDRWGGQCCAEFGIQPKGIDDFGGNKLDFKKLKYYQCEFRTRFHSKNGSDQWWHYSDDAEKNIQIANQIYDYVSAKVIPVINLFNRDEFILDRIELADLNDLYKCLPQKLAGLSVMTTDIRFAWSMTRVYEKRNLTKAKEFAKYGLSKLNVTDTFLGKPDFERVLSLNNEE